MELVLLTIAITYPLLSICGLILDKMVHFQRSGSWVKSNVQSVRLDDEGLGPVSAKMGRDAITSDPGGHKDVWRQ